MKTKAAQLISDMEDMQEVLHNGSHASCAISTEGLDDVIALLRQRGAEIQRLETQLGAANRAHKRFATRHHAAFNALNREHDALREENAALHEYNTCLYAAVQVLRVM